MDYFIILADIENLPEEKQDEIKTIYMMVFEKFYILIKNPYFRFFCLIAFCNDPYLPKRNKCC